MMKKIRTVLIGAGYRGCGLLRILQSIDNFEVVAVFDPSSNKPCDLENIDIMFYNKDNDDYQRMIIEQKPDLAIIASPWKFHIEQAMFALGNHYHRCHVAIEIKGGFCIDEYKPLLETAEKYSLNIFPLENAVFMRENMAMLNIVKKGILGNIVAVKGGYRHDLRGLLVDDNGKLGNPNKPEGIWRSQFYTTENCDLYPTHGLAPVCLAIGIGRTDYITELTSFSSRACGMHEYILQHGGDTSVPIAMGDIIITQMRSEKNILITLTHDTTLPRPRSLDFEIQGSKGIWRGEFRKIYIEGLSPYEEWEDDLKYIEENEHRFWQLWGTEATRIDVHHKGMDYIMLRAVAAHIQGEDTYPLNGHDLALWTSITPYSKISISEKRTVEIPRP